MDEYKRVRQGRAVSDKLDGVDVGAALAKGYDRSGHIPQRELNGENLLQQLAKQCIRDSDIYFPNFASQHSSNCGRLMHYALGLLTEAGEFGEIVKKIDRGSLDYDAEGVRMKLEEEAVDTLIYLMNVFGELGIDPLKAYLKKRNFNHGRFVEKNGRDGRG